ncbi:hypothetical protein BOTBODRAFT_66094 [Botryobasidium botryosum FD-172 SS1]|uniref:Ferritin-like domain-containing protein n=1 Tax=Botryobasidium botryosum (strain FD-172 SS1) TaxID=930990 RepID=A0A067MFE2_BOTB1|nr:hypothetical protein BOTBODRAFT_66094 [Botryobasidium botryosum FD-172 SS1]
MKLFFTALAVVAAAVSVAASPAKRAPSETDALQFVLAFEHVEHAFYTNALAMFDEQAFADAGFPPWVRGRFEQIAEHEAAHVAFLTNALGKTAVQPCTYDFNVSSPIPNPVQSFVFFAARLEDEVVSAYLGALQYIKNPAYLTAVAAILSTESRHQAWISSAVQHLNPWSGAFGTPLDFDESYAFLTQYDTSCPSTNPPLPVDRKIPDITYLAEDGDVQGGRIKIFSKLPSDKNLSVAFLSGLSPVFEPLHGDEFRLPEIGGTLYFAVTTSDSVVNDDNLVTTPAIVYLPFPANATSP